MTNIAVVHKWRKKLDEELSKRQPDYRKHSDYYDGKQRLLYSSDKWRAAFGAIFKDFSDNWCELVVDAVEERLNIVGFRYGDSGGDQQAWNIWQSNNMDALSQICHTDVLIQGIGYVMVWADDDNQPSITVESPTQVIVANSQSDRDERICAYKRWVDEDNYANATVYFPDEIFKFKSKEPMSLGFVWNVDPTYWVPRLDTEDSGQWPLPNPLNIVPIVPMVNRPRLALTGFEPYLGKSEIKGVIPVQDAVNKVLLDMLIASDFSSFRQRWVTGMEIPVDPETNRPVEPFKAAVDRIWMAENPEVKFGEFSEADLTSYVKSVEMLIQHIASTTRTPPHYFYLSGNFPSGESIKSAETGLVAKSRRKMRHFSDPWEEVMRLCFMVLNDPRQKVTNSEVIWGDPESHSEAEMADSLVKKQAIGVPEEQLWEDAGYSPQQIRRFKMLVAQERMQNALLAPNVFGQAPPTPGSPPQNPQLMPPVPAPAPTPTPSNGGLPR